MQSEHPEYPLGDVTSSGGPAAPLVALSRVGIGLLGELVAVLVQESEVADVAALEPGNLRDAAFECGGDVCHGQAEVLRCEA